MSTKIQISNLHKSFGSKSVLSGIDLAVEKGESLVILGGSGSGKSVLIKIISGLLNADSGSVKIDGHETANLNDQKRDILMEKFGFLFQGGALLTPCQYGKMWLSDCSAKKN